MAAEVTLDGNGIRIDGEYRVLLCASLFYFRIPAELWEDRILRLKDAGYNCVDVYFPWNHHETAPGRWDLAGDRDADRFLGLLADAGLFVVARPGPYICSEWDGGALPAWILASGKPIREDDPGFLEPVGRWYDRILPVIARREVGRGGTVILVQLENELDFFDCPDPKSYMESLARMARARGVSVPLFGCAGQFSAAGATGFAEDVLVTYNAYPSLTDPHFDRKCRSAAQVLAGVDRPLLITETGREHSLLRREMASGAKLLGAYNQVAGTNFGFTNSVNNWGSPLGFIASDYDFLSMIDAAGAYRGEALEGRLLGGLIETLGESLATARATTDASVSADCPFRTAAGGVPVLELGGGGRLLCLPNLSETAGTATVRVGGLSFDVRVDALRSPLLPIDLPLGKTGWPGRIRHASAEVLRMEEGLLTLYADGDAVALLEPDEGEAVLLDSRDGTATLPGPRGPLEVRFLSREEAARHDPAGRWAARVDHAVTGAAPLLRGRFAAYEPDWVPAAAGPDPRMETRGLPRGFARYGTGTPEGGASDVLLQGVADIVSAYDATGFLDLRVSGGQWQRYRGQGGPWRFKVESWGHCNFDDPRLPSLRMASGKGVAAAFDVAEEEDLSGNWHFQLRKEWRPEALDYRADPFDAPLEPNAWNSTRRPLVALYYTDIRPRAGSDAWALHVAGGRAEVSVHLDGRPVGLLDPLDPYLRLPFPVPGGGPSRLELQCRKRDWNEPVGVASLLHLRELPLAVSGFTEEDLSRLSVPEGEEAALPFRLEPGRSFLAEFDLDVPAPRCAFVRLAASDLKATAVFNGRTVGRVFGACAGRPFLSGGDDSAFYVPGPWYRKGGNRLVLFLEPTGPSPVLTSLTMEPASR